MITLCSKGFASTHREKQLCAAFLLGSVLLSGPENGAIVAMESTAMLRLLEMACSSVPWVQSLAAHEKGRPLFGNLAATEALELLMSSPSQSVAASAASAVAKLS